MTGPVLAVDDDPDVRELLALALEVGGLDAQVVGTAAEARAAAAARPPALLLIDAQLGACDGVALGAELRAATGPVPPPVLVILSGCVDAALEARSAAAGARAVLGKPFDPLALGATLASIAGG